LNYPEKFPASRVGNGLNQYRYSFVYQDLRIQTIPDRPANPVMRIWLTSI